MINPNGINYKELKELNMTLDDLIELMRGCNVFKIEEKQVLCYSLLYLKIVIINHNSLFYKKIMYYQKARK